MSSAMKLSLACLILLKLWLLNHLALIPNPDAGYDDALFLSLARYLAAGDWLGPYSHVTLVKGPGYPLWIALNFYTGLSLTLGQFLLYAGAGLYLVSILSGHLQKKGWLVVFYGIYLFNPVCEVILQRVIRENLYVSLTVLLVVGILGLHFADNLTKLAGRSLLLGLILGLLWLTREEGIWVLPMIILPIAYFILDAYQKYRWSKQLLLRASLLLMPFVVLFLSVQAVAMINWHYYGVYTTVELKADAFVAAYSALSRVKGLAEHPPYIPVPEGVRQAAYSVSPSFAELKDSLERAAWHGDTMFQGKFICSIYPICDHDIYGGWFIWALRDAAMLKGYHVSAERAQDYYQRIATEINTACDMGQLSCMPLRHGLAPPLEQIDFYAVLRRFILAASALSGVEFKTLYHLSSYTPAEKTDDIYDMTHALVIPSAKQSDSFASRNGKPVVIISGIVAATDIPRRLYLQVSSRNNELERFSYERMNSLNFARGKNLADDPFVGKSRFELITDCIQNCELRVYDDKGLVGIISHEQIKPGRQVLSEAALEINIDKLETRYSPPLFTPDLDSGLIKLKAGVIGWVAACYPFIFLALTVLGLISYIARVSIAFARRQLSSLMIINSGILLAIGLRLSILAVIDASAFPALNLTYLSPLYPLLIIFAGLAVIDLFSSRAAVSGGKGA